MLASVLRCDESACSPLMFERALATCQHKKCKMCTSCLSPPPPPRPPPPPPPSPRPPPPRPPPPRAKRKDTPPAPPGTCAARGARCDAEACCEHKSEDCYERDAGFARCLMRCDPSLPAFADWSCAFHPRPPPAPPSRLSRVKSKVADLLSKTNAYEDKLSAYVADS